MLTPEYELQLLTSGKYSRIIGIDEAGRAPWAGPVSVGAFAFEINTKALEGINDSKQVTIPRREALFKELKQQNFQVRFGSEKRIDNEGIAVVIEDLISSLIEYYGTEDTLFLVDGQFRRDFGASVHKVIKGDSLYYSIAAASITAKVSRDNLMKHLDKVYPGYGFASHKGYGTKQHFQMIQELGICEIHRRSFRPISSTIIS